MTGLVVAVCNHEYVVGELDVKRPFVQTGMSGTLVYIKCAWELKRLIIKVYFGLAKFMGPDCALCVSNTSI